MKPITLEQCFSNFLDYNNEAVSTHEPLSMVTYQHFHIVYMVKYFNTNLHNHPTKQ